ncbi:MAG: hypothetical protein CENE_02898 [Candidatus Celerinatantimonas neptuna]|nr:MAG: hypothetical protein CENE_02898 [Candidatus Celerinatantimonas neptuna]
MQVCFKDNFVSVSNMLLATENASDRTEIEKFIANRYQAAFSASIPHFFPYLVAKRNSFGEIDFACGFQDATKPLYLEHYLSEPAETLLGRLFNRQCNRDEIVEIGQLATFSIRLAPELFLAIAQLLLSMGFRWAMATVTGPLLALCKRCGMKPVHIACAYSQQVGTEQSLWGNYYQYHPQVVCAELIQVASQLSHYVNHPTRQISSSERFKEKANGFD